MSEKKEYKKPFNPSIGSGFQNDAFGEGSVKVDITAEGLDALMKNLQVGSAILLKYNRVTAKGNKHYFAEILPPYKKPEVKPAKVDTSELG